MKSVNLIANIVGYKYVPPGRGSVTSPYTCMNCGDVYNRSLGFTTVVLDITDKDQTVCPGCSLDLGLVSKVPFNIGDLFRLGSGLFILTETTPNQVALVGLEGSPFGGRTLHPTIRVANVKSIDENEWACITGGDRHIQRVAEVGGYGLKVEAIPF